MKSEPQGAAFNAPQIPSLLKHLTEATRADPNPDFYIPPAGADEASAEYHHVIFGQRGSGKSSLLHKLRREKEHNRRAAVWIDGEVFSNLTYPNVLVNCLICVARDMRALTADSANTTKRRWWKKSSERHSEDRSAGLERMVDNLQSLLGLPDEREIQWTRNASSSAASDLMGSISIGSGAVAKSEGKTTRALSNEMSSMETISSSKQKYLDLNLPMFREVLHDAAKQTDGGFIMMDDFYHLNRSDQPAVLGYMHKLVKDSGLYLKVGTIRSATSLYRDNPPVGMQLRHDAQEVSLDRQFSLYNKSKSFLEEILQNICTKSDVEMRLLFSDGAFSRLMLASGGVARDYLVLTKEAIEVARNRGPKPKAGSNRVTVEDVNQAASNLFPSKLDDLKTDDPTRAQALERRTTDLTEFCKDRQSAYFLVDTQDAELIAEIDALQNLRFASLLYQSETVPDIRSQRFNVWLLDVSMLSYQRARSIDFDGWADRESRRKRKLIYTRDWRSSQSNEKVVRPQRMPGRANSAQTRQTDSDDTLF